MNEYYVTVDEAEHCVSVSTYIFNCFHPNGIEKKLSTIHYDGKSGFTYEEAEKFMTGICDNLNRTNWRKENDVYDKP